MAKNLTSADFQETIDSADVPVLVDFWAPWCGPCKMLGPVIEEISQEYEGKVIVAKLNVDDAQAIAQKFGIMSIPSVLIFKDGEVVESAVGVRPKKYYVDALDSLV